MNDSLEVFADLKIVHLNNEIGINAEGKSIRLSFKNPSSIWSEFRYIQRYSKPFTSLQKFDNFLILNGLSVAVCIGHLHFTVLGKGVPRILRSVLFRIWRT